MVSCNHSIRIQQKQTKQDKQTIKNRDNAVFVLNVDLFRVKRHNIPSTNMYFTKDADPECEWTPLADIWLFRQASACWQTHFVHEAISGCVLRIQSESWKLISYVNKLQLFTELFTPALPLICLISFLN